MTTEAHIPTRAGTLPLIGGVLALDFCNTSSGRGTDRLVEHLRSVADVVTWARHAGILDADTAARLGAHWAANPGAAERFLARAIALRDAIYGLDAALARGRAPDPATLDHLARDHAACLAQGRLTTANGGFGWSWTVEEAPEAVILGPITASAMTVITAADRARLKQCGGHHCGWLFLDTTKSNNRRWCEMEPCGNRAKQSRRRARPG